MEKHPALDQLTLPELIAFARQEMPIFEHDDGTLTICFGIGSLTLSETQAMSFLRGVVRHLTTSPRIAMAV